MINEMLLHQIKKLPLLPGVYLFKDEHGLIIYIGKAKKLRSRVKNYLQQYKTDLKSQLILDISQSAEHIVTTSEREAILLEAQLIQQHQPKYNVLLKTGQPFLYLMITASKPARLTIVRNKKFKGTYFGPFIEKGPARKVFDFLTKTFRLKLCGKLIENGCLYYHLGICSGSCRNNFDYDAYCERLELAKKSLKQGHKKFLNYLKEQIELCNEQLAFERSRELHNYLQAFEQVFDVLDIKPSVGKYLTQKDVWVVIAEKNSLFVFSEKQSELKQKQVFRLPFESKEQKLHDCILERMRSYYRVYQPAGLILINADVSDDERELLKQFFADWHSRDDEIIIMWPGEGHNAGIMRVAKIKAEQSLERQLSLGKALKQLLRLSFEPKTIDCFDISHKQGMYQVGSCIRFENGEPKKDKFRKFNIKTVHQSDDYACLREVVSRRYKDQSELPDLILIDGGKGQLNAVKNLFPEVEFASLAKREETIFSDRLSQGRVLDRNSYVGQMLIALRDYTHHFAITHHRSRERRGIKKEK